MKKLKLIIIFILLYSCCSTRTASDIEFDRLRKLFKNEYQKKEYPMYSKEIIKLDEGNWVCFIFENDSIKLDRQFKDYSSIFSSGLISPILIGSGYLISIDKVIELCCDNKCDKLRRFKVEGRIKSHFNSFVSFIEIKNDNGTSKTQLNDFVNGAKTAFFITEWH
jgi:hypothetical protein